jgi:hypothetical protein
MVGIFFFVYENRKMKTVEIVLSGGGMKENIGEGESN